MKSNFAILWTSIVFPWKAKKTGDSTPTDVTEDKGTKAQAQAKDSIEELEGQTGKDDQKDGLMSSVLENDKETVEDGKLLEESINQGVGSFTPDIMFAQMCQNYKHAKKLYGETLLKAVSGYDDKYLERNMNVPEFRKELEKKIKHKVDDLQKKGFINKEGEITNRGMELASLVLYASELDIITPIGVRGERVHKERSHYGGKGDTHPYKKGERFKDVDVKKSIKTALRRGRDKLQIEDLKVHERQSKGEVNIIYAIDSSGSMRGDKIGTCKKAGVALCWQAIQNKDKVGLVVFGETVTDVVYPTKDFQTLLRSLTNIKASKETNISHSIEKSIELFPKNGTKHLMVLTDGLPTTGEDPQQETLQACSQAASAGITISIVGINLDSDGAELAQKMVEIGSGKLYAVSNLDDVDRIVLMDYHSYA